MNVLAIDAATDAAGVALAAGGRTRSRPVAWRRSFAETAPAAEALLVEAGLAWGDLAALAVPAGPGSFTGLRVGAAFALGVAETREVALHAVPTLIAVAEAYAPPGAPVVCADLDARRGRRYVARVERSADGWRDRTGALDLSPDEAEALADGAPRVGPRAGDEPSGAVAAALAGLVARFPDRWRLPAPDRLVLAYARPGVEAP